MLPPQAMTRETVLLLQPPAKRLMGQWIKHLMAIRSKLLMVLLSTATIMKRGSWCSTKPSIFLGTADGYETLAQEFGIPLLNETLAEILSDNRLKSDTIHPNEKGYRVLAEGVYGLLQESGAL